MAGLWARARGQAASPLEQELQNATYCDSLDAPKGALEYIAEASRCHEDRQVIMRHINACLSEPSSNRWRRIYLGLVVIEDLMSRGAPELISETADGMHFDLVQRLTFLERFKHGSDPRVESMVSRKATAMRAAWLEQQEQNGGGSSLPAGRNDSSSAGRISSGAASSGPRAQAQTQESRSSARNYGLGGLVHVGHRDDTDSSEDEAPRGASNGRGGHSGAAVSGNQGDKARGGSNYGLGNVVSLKHEDDTDESGDEGKRRSRRGQGNDQRTVTAPPPAPATAPTADLLDFGSAQAPVKASAPAPSSDLLDLM